jgi:leucyl/phenylalanyl-tRNA--protein transferase
VRIGAAFFGESMFSRATDASKVALVHLVARLKAGNFQLLDAQFTTPHLESLGARTVGRADYHALLERAIDQDAHFFKFTGDRDPEAVLRLAGKADA